MESNNIRLSHVLYRVQDLHGAVKKLRDAGFIVEYGTEPEKAYNAMIWFDKGVFIEIYRHPELSVGVKWLMKRIGYKSIVQRMDKWKTTENNWCEWSLESTATDLQTWKNFFRREKIPFKLHKTRRKTKDGKMLSWYLLFPKDIQFPFLMSAYTPNPRPQKTIHPNGVTGINSLIVGEEKLNVLLLNKLLIMPTGLKLVKGKIGLQTVELSDPSVKIEKILSKYEHENR